jgi:ATP-binding cassette subfamily B protein
VIVAHRPETLDSVDEVLLLRDGQVVEHGDRERLVANSDSAFSRLLAAGQVFA